MGRFMLLAARRSGTSFLLSSLNSHPQIQCYKNVFHRRKLLKKFFYFEQPGTPFFRYMSASVGRRIDYMFRRKHLIGAFLTELYGSANGSKAVVVRIAYPHEYPEVLEWVIENDVGIIHLIRENFLKSIVYYSSSKGKPTVHLSPGVLKRRLTERSKQVDKYRAMFKNKPYLEVSDESFESNREVESQRILDFLSVNGSVPLTFGLRMRNPELEDSLENYEEVAQAFRSTVFEKYL